MSAVRATRAALAQAPARFGNRPQLLLMAMLSAMPPCAAPVGSASGGHGAGSELFATSGGAAAEPSVEADSENARRLSARLLLRACCAVVVPRVAPEAARLASAAIAAVGGMGGSPLGMTVGRGGRESREQRKNRVERQRRAAAEAACPDLAKVASRSRCPPSGTASEEAADGRWWQAQRRRAIGAIEETAGIRKKEGLAGSEAGGSAGDSESKSEGVGESRQQLVDRIFRSLPLDPAGLEEECPAASDRILLRSPGIAIEMARRRAALAPLLWRRAAEAEQQSVRTRRASAASRAEQRMSEAESRANVLREQAEEAKRKAKEEEEAEEAAAAAAGAKGKGKGKAKPKKGAKGKGKGKGAADPEPGEE